MTTPPRRPGSQVAPGQKPLFTDGRTASTHSKVPIDQATAGRRYRVRDKDWVAVWGEDLPWDEANKLKDQVVAQRKSRTARVEDMEVPPPIHVSRSFADPALDAPAVAQIQQDGTTVIQMGAREAAFELVGAEPQTIPSNGVVCTIPAAHELLVNGAAAPVPATVAAGDVVQAHPMDPYLAGVQRAALAAVRPLIAPTAPKKPLGQAHRDKTVTIPPRRSAPPPRDKTVTQERPFVRLGVPPSTPPQPPRSPLTTANELDGPELPPDAITDLDLPDLAGDVGGGPTDDDIALANRQREAERG